jgi:peptide/nickel transport system permease protein
MTSVTASPDLEFAAARRGLAAQALRRFAHRPVAMLALVVIAAILVGGALVHVIAPQGWNWINLSPSALHRAPSLAHPFGTDEIGRDVLVRTLYGVRTTEEVALAGAAIATLLGVFIGALAGYYGGWLDAILMRIADLITSYPAVILTLAAIVYLGEPYPHDLILIFGGYMWAVAARVVRAHVASLREQDFVDAARALGSSDARILVRHLLPNVGGTILVAATALVGQIVLIDATVEFFYYGLPASVAPSLGNLVTAAVQVKFGFGTNPTPGAGSWWIWLFPGLVLILILVCVNLIGDALDAALNPSAERG